MSESSKVPLLPKGVYVTLKSSGEMFIASRKPEHPEVILIGGQRKIMGATGQIEDKVASVWPVTEAFFDEMYKISNI